MSVTVQWDNDERTAILLTFVAPWTWEEFHGTNNEMNQMLDEAPHKADVIIDLSASGAIPRDSLTRLGAVYQRPHPNARRYMICGASSLMQALIGTADRLYSFFKGESAFVVVDDLIAARELVATAGQDSG